MKKNKIVKGYVRVSTREQVEGYSIDAQIKIINDFAEINDMGAVEIISDLGISAKNLDRPGISKLISDVVMGNVTDIIIHKQDRLSRSIYDFNKILTLCLEHDVNLYSITENLNYNSATGRGMGNMIMGFAQMERELIGERTRDGLVEKARQGKYPHGGHLPLGFYKDKDSHVHKNKDIKIIRLIIDKYIEGVSLEGISNYLLQTYKISWKPEYIREVINKPIYRGEVKVDGRIFKICEPTITIEELAFFNSPKQRLVYLNKHKYIFQNKVYYGEDQKLMKHTTQYKKQKGGKKMIKYYYLRKGEKGMDHSIFISEQKLVKLVNLYAIEIQYNTSKSLKNKLKRIDELYANGDITKYKYTELRNKLLKKQKDNSMFVKKIFVKFNKEIEVEFI